MDILLLILVTLLVFVGIGVFWAAVSVGAYILSSIIHSNKPIGLVVALTVIMKIILMIYLFIWYVGVSFSLFKEGEIIFGLIFVFFLGGLIMGIYSFLANLIIIIPSYFSDKYEKNLEYDQSHAGRGEIIEGEATTTKDSDYNDDQLIEWDKIK